MALLSFKWFFASLFLVQPKESGPEAAESFHPFYVSVTEIHHNATDKALEISCKIFIDDMEETLRKNYKTKVDLSSEPYKEQNNKLIADYISKHLAFVADGKPQKLSYVGYEKDSEAVLCYFEVLNLPTIKKLDVTNSILQDYTPEQSNIMHVYVNGNRKSYKLDYPKSQASFAF